MSGASDNIGRESGAPHAAPLVSVVVLTWNSGPRIFECLEGVWNQSYPSIETILVDNGSTDGAFDEALSKWGGRLRAVRNEENLGFARGMNQGIELARGEYVLLLNDDLYLEETYIERAVRALERADEEMTGMLSGVVLKHADGKRTHEIDAAGLFLLPYLTVGSSPRTDEAHYVFGPSGAALFLSRRMLDAVRLPGGDFLDSTYFVYGEDIELCLRAQLFGWKCLFVPVVVGWHAGSASVGRRRLVAKGPAHQIHAVKNRFLTISTCYPAPLWLWTLPWNLIADVGFVAAALVKGRPRMLLNWFRAAAAAARLAPRSWRKRRWIQERRRVSFAYLRGLYLEQSVWKTWSGLIRRA